MRSAFKYFVAILLATVTTLLLFFTMQSLIVMGSGDLKKEKRRRVLDVVMPDHELALIQEIKKPKKLSEPEKSPPVFALTPIDMSFPDAINLKMAAVRPDSVHLSGVGLGASDGEYLPIVKVPPVYPSNALSRGIQGFVIVEFTVTKTGSVIDPHVVEAFDEKGNPTALFNRAAIKAVKKFKYHPKIVDGDPVSVAGVQNKIIFRIDK